MNTLFALVLPCDISALSGTSQIFSPKPINNDAADVAQSFAPGNQMFPRPGLGETGFIDGRNVAIEFRWARNDNDRLHELAADRPPKGRRYRRTDDRAKLR
jgi:hypothetical protein